MHSSVTDRDKEIWKNNQRPANSQIYKDTQLHNIYRDYTIIEYKSVMRKFFQCDELQKSIQMTFVTRHIGKIFSCSLHNVAVYVDNTMHCHCHYITIPPKVQVTLRDNNVDQYSAQ